MNHILKILDKDYALALLKRKVLPQYPQFKGIKDLEIVPHKKYIWESTYHVVFELKTIFVDKAGGETILPIFCAAHSSEPRENVFRTLNFLWDHGFSGDFLTIPRPLFFSPYLKGVFYRGVPGHNLHYYMSQKDKAAIEMIVPQAARWFAKLHNISSLDDYDFNLKSGRIRTVVPGIDKILEEIETNHPEYTSFYRGAYELFMSREEEFLDSTKKRWLIHGDAHPENIIRMSDEKLAVIDFSDTAPSDFARDLGCFLEQFEYMAQKENYASGYVEKIKKLFLDNYFADAKEELTPDVENRIQNYYYWTKLRTITYLLVSGVINRDEAKMIKIRHMIGELKQSLNI